MFDLREVLQNQEQVATPREREARGGEHWIRLSPVQLGSERKAELSIPHATQPRGQS